MSQNGALIWTLGTMAIASAYVAYKLFQKPQNAGVEEVGQAEHRLDPILDREQNEHRQPEGIAGEQHDEQIPDGVPVGVPDAAGVRGEAAPVAEQDVGAAWDNDDRARRALEEHQAAQAGQEPERVNAWKQRGEVGTKKAKSLAKRDQRRAYYEYVRQQAEQRKEEVSMYEEAFGDLIAKEREERQRKIDAAKAEIEEYNNYRRQLEEEDRNDRRERRERISKALRDTGSAKLDEEDGLELEIAENITGAIVLENEQYAVSVTPKLVNTLASQLEAKGRVGLDELRVELERTYSTSS